MLSRKVMASGARVDPNFKNVTLLLHGDGTNGGQNNTFIDGSSNNVSITRVGTVTQGSFNPYGSLWSNYFDGSGDYLQWTGTAIGSGDFTAECWVRPQDLPGTNKAVIGSASANTSAGWEIYIQNNVFAFYSNGANVILTTTTLTVNNWYHVAAVRSGSTLRIYINGVDSGNATFTGNLTNTTFYVSWDFASQAINAYISNVRHVVGTAVYTAAFTPPTTNLTAIANTSVLTCQSNRFVDNSTNNYTITRNGDTKVTSFSPFQINSVYTSATGGSGYFISGVSGKLDTATTATFAFGTGDFTLESWIYPLAYPNDCWILGFGNAALNNPAFMIYNGALHWHVQYGAYQAFGLPVVLGQWSHVALVRQGGTLYGFLNGVRGSTSHTYTTSIGNSFIRGGEGEVYGGWHSDDRVSNVALYTSATYDVPTSRLAATSSTSLLISYTNAAIFDSTAKNDLETVGNAQIDTGTKKFGTGSLEFDGSGDYLRITSNLDLYTFGRGDWTIEFWIYFDDVTTARSVLGMRPQSTNGAYPAMYVQSGTLRYYANTGDRISGSVSISTWYHVAVARSGTSTKMFIDGTQAGSTYTDSTNYSCGRVVIGCSDLTLGNDGFDGFIDDLRITKGVARYTANFTPPTLPFPDK